MEDMDIEQVVDIPDTPDRINARHISGAQLGKERTSSVVGHSRTSDFRNRECLNEPKPRSRLVSDDGYNRRLHLSPGRIPVKMDEFETRNNSTALSPLQNSYSSQNASLFRRGAMANKSKPESQQSTRMQHMDKGKAECSKNSFKSLDEDALFNMAFQCSASKAPHAEETKNAQVSSSINGFSLHSFPITSRNCLKGKEKVDVNACNGFGSAINHGKGTDLKIEKQSYASPPSVPSPRVTGQKRLVRNGCISPHNIASRAQKLSETCQVGSSNVGKDHSSNMVSDATSDVDIKEIVAEANNEETDCHRAKGKGVITHPSVSKQHDGKLIHVSTSSGTNNTASNEASDSGGGPLLNGWRSTRNRTNRIFVADDDDDEVFVDEQHVNIAARRNKGSANILRNARNLGDQGETTSRIVAGRINHPQSTGNVHAKRQKKHGITLRNQNRWPRIFPEDSDVMLLGSSEESSSSRSSRTLNRQNQGILEPIYEIDDSLSERKTDNSKGLGSMNEEDADARARQVEADEILARELQEQLYHEAPIFGGSEIDESLAWVLQQEEDAFPTASGLNNPSSRLRTSSSVHANRRPQPHFFQNPSNRRGSQSRVPATRTSQLRNRIFNRSPAGLSRVRNHSRAALPGANNFRFPLGMDLDMRLDILEALEDAVGELNDMSMTANDILNRDFNENDYEMLLALDENNHQRGASVNRINSLPETVVQTENFEESCAICLETPSIGETIRHLPCFHKFHKECIDPWLSRRTSCPVCKSSIT